MDKTRNEFRLAKSLSQLHDHVVAVCVSWKRTRDDNVPAQSQQSIMIEHSCLLTGSEQHSYTNYIPHDWRHGD